MISDTSSVPSSSMLDAILNTLAVRQTQAQGEQGAVQIVNGVFNADNYSI